MEDIFKLEFGNDEGICKGNVYIAQICDIVFVCQNQNWQCVVYVQFDMIVVEKLEKFGKDVDIYIVFC